MMEARVFEKALTLYGITEQHITGRLSGGTYNAVYEFEQGDEQYVIRIGELEFDQETTMFFFHVSRVTCGLSSYGSMLSISKSVIR